MSDYIERERIEKYFDGIYDCADLIFEPHDQCCAADDCAHCKWFETKNAIKKRILSIPAADVIDEENVLKFYYVRSTDDYWIGQRVGNFYYAEFDPEALRWTWTHSRYLPWGEHVVSPTSLWKEHTYPSKPEEMPFEEWMRGLIKKYFPAADVRPVKWIPVTERLPSDFVSVQAHMTDAGNFPPVREAYVVDKLWFFPALKEFHPVDMWRQFDEPPKEE